MKGCVTLGVVLCCFAMGPAADDGGTHLHAPRGPVAISPSRRAAEVAAPRDSAEATAQGVVLHEIHELSGRTTVDTITTFLMPGRVRVSHRDGDALLDVPNDRFVLLSPAEKSYRVMSLADWEQRIRDALSVAATSRRKAAGGKPAAPPAEPLAFESEGNGGQIVGYACERWHLFTHREVFPGEVEAVEEEIWVTRELELTPETSVTYQRVLGNLDRIELDAPVARPAGVVLRTVRVRRSEGRPPANEIETTEVIAVDRHPIPDSVFAIPRGYALASSSDPAAQPGR